MVLHTVCVLGSASSFSESEPPPLFPGSGGTILGRGFVDGVCFVISLFRGTYVHPLLLPRSLPRSSYGACGREEVHLNSREEDVALHTSAFRTETQKSL